jgi:YebC/PmpR family DNA-binding regulatory protein
MSKHSKWAKVKNQKGATDAKRSAIFTRLARGITVAAKEKGGDPVMNFQLRMAIDQAREANMPKDNIERAIKRGTSESGETVQYEQLIYEAFGPGGVGILIEILTENRNRAASDVKHILSKNGGSLGASGSVRWMFEQKGILQMPFAGIKNRDEIEMTAIDAGAVDIKDEDGLFTIYTAPNDLEKVKSALEMAGLKIEYAGLGWVTKEKIAVPDDIRAKLEDLFSDLEENEDVSEYYTNADI